ncbi:sigma-70 family RNA polymerase sigma factor [Virgibacillus dakarensis]|nr:sigma-70 family RNA polymerase sigma factor [Virgibacillus dakarensis]
MNWTDQLIHEYKIGKSQLLKIKNSLNKNVPADREDLSHINSMISDMDYSLEWLRKGRRPGNMRGIDKRSAYQRRVLIDMDLLPALELEPEEKTISDEQKALLADILIDLSDRERHCYLLHMANGWTITEISGEIGVSRGTVQSYIDRAKEKIKSKIPCLTNAV